MNELAPTTGQQGYRGTFNAASVEGGSQVAQHETPQAVNTLVNPETLNANTTGDIAGDHVEGFLGNYSTALENVANMFEEKPQTTSTETKESVSKQPEEHEVFNAGTKKQGTEEEMFTQQKEKAQGQKRQQTEIVGSRNKEIAKLKQAVRILSSRLEIVEEYTKAA